MAEIKLSDFCFSSEITHQLTAQKQICSSIHEEGRVAGNQADGGKNRTAFQTLRRGNGFLCGSAPTMNVLQCASATCFCHRFAMLSCLNLIGWRGGREGSGRKAGDSAVKAAFTSNGCDRLLSLTKATRLLKWIKCPTCALSDASSSFTAKRFNS